MQIFTILVTLSLVGQLLLLNTTVSPFIQKGICIITTGILLVLTLGNSALSLPSAFAILGSILCMFKTKGECWRVIGWYTVVIFVLYLIFHKKEGAHNNCLQYTDEDDCNSGGKWRSFQAKGTCSWDDTTYKCINV